MKKVVSTLVLLLPWMLVHAQSASELDQLLGSKAVSWSMAARFVLPAAGILPDDADPETAFSAALSAGWIRPGTRPEDPLTLAQAAYLCMAAFELQGGVMYGLVPGPRYAYRELIHRRFIQGRADPAMKVPGDRLVRILGRVLSFTGDDV